MEKCAPRIWTFVLAFALGVASPLSAQHEGDGDAADRKEPTLAEAKAEFAAADEELNRVYGRAKQVLGEWKFEQLKLEQKEWLEYRDACAMSDAVFNGGQKFYQREKEAPDYWESLAGNSETRSAMITGWWPRKNMRVTCRGPANGTMDMVAGCASCNWKSQLRPRRKRTIT